MPRFRFVDIGAHDPFQAVARMPVLGGSVAETGEPLLLTAIWGSTHVNVGWFDDIDSTLDLDACRELGIEVIRRPVFGGGTAFYEAGCAVMCSFLLPKDAHPDLDAELDHFQPIYLDALARLGLQDVKFEGSSDLRWEGRKLGALIAQDAMTVNMVGGFLNIARTDIDLYLKVARIPDDKFKDKVVKDMRDYICTAPEVAGHDVTYEDYRDAVVAACQSHDIELRPEPLRPEEDDSAAGFRGWIAGDDHLKRISSERFVAAAPAGSRVGFGNHKGAKLCRAGVAIDSAGVITNAMMAGDMHVGPPDVIDRVAEALAGVSAEDESDLRARIATVFEGDDVTQPDAHLGITTEDLLAATLKAVAAAA